VRKGEKGTTVVFADRFIPYRERTRAAKAVDEPEAIPFLKRLLLERLLVSWLIQPDSRKVELGPDYPS
jgi:hypothetical protein